MSTQKNPFQITALGVGIIGLVLLIVGLIDVHGNFIPLILGTICLGINVVFLAIGLQSDVPSIEYMYVSVRSREKTEQHNEEKQGVKPSLRVYPELKHSKEQIQNVFRHVLRSRAQTSDEKQLREGLFNWYRQNETCHHLVHDSLEKVCTRVSPPSALMYNLAHDMLYHGFDEAFANHLNELKRYEEDGIMDKRALRDVVELFLQHQSV
jgi:hypothetical protein